MIKKCFILKKYFLNITFHRLFSFFYYSDSLQNIKSEISLFPQKIKFPYIIIYLCITNRTQSIHYDSIYISVNNSLFYDQHFIIEIGGIVMLC